VDRTITAPGSNRQNEGRVAAAKDRRIKALEEENRKLKAELKVANGKLYEQV
jgi:hypothetical protein